MATTEYKPGDLSKLLGGSSGQEIDIKDLRPKGVPMDVKSVGSSAGSEKSHENEKSQSSKATGKKKERNKQKKKEFKNQDDPEKTARTVFVGNIPLLPKVDRKLKSIFEKAVGSVESVRIRSVPIAKTKISAGESFRTMRKAASIQKNYNAKGLQSCVGFVVFSGAELAEKAVQQMTKDPPILEGFKLRVDLAGSSSFSRVFERKRSVFVGQLPFSTDEKKVKDFFQTYIEKTLRSKNDPKYKGKSQEDETASEDVFSNKYELAKQAAKAEKDGSGQKGIEMEEGDLVENVRLIRDKFSNRGKGFGYVLLKSRELVKVALELNKKTFEGREISVKRCERSDTLQKKKKDKKVHGFEGKKASNYKVSSNNFKRKSFQGNNSNKKKKVFKK